MIADHDHASVLAEPHDDHASPDAGHAEHDDHEDDHSKAPETKEEALAQSISIPRKPGVEH